MKPTTTTLLGAISSLWLLVSCAPSSQEGLSDADIVILATHRCLVETGLFTPEEARELPRQLATRYTSDSPVDKEWREAYSRINSFVDRGITEADYSRLMESKPMEDCTTAAIIWMGEYLPESLFGVAVDRLGSEWLSGQKSNQTLSELLQDNLN